MKIISVLTQKGGVGKTTCAIHIAGYLAQQNNKILMIDLDNQCNLSTGFQLDEIECPDIFDFMKGNLNNVHQKNENISIIKGNINLSATLYNRFSLKNVLDKLEGFDWVIIDCPPAGINNNLSLGEIAVCASDYIISPAEADIYSINGLINLINGISGIKIKYNSSLKYLGIFINKALVNTSTFSEYYYMLKESLPADYFFETYVRQDSIVNKAKKTGKTVFDFNKNSRAYIDFTKLCEEMLKKINN